MAQKQPSVSHCRFLEGNAFCTGRLTNATGLDIEKLSPRSARTFTWWFEMSVVAGTAYPPSRCKLGQVAVLILALLGLISFAAVRDMAGQCRIGCLADSGGCLGDASGVLQDGKTTRCELAAGGWLRIALSEQSADTLRRF